MKITINIDCTPEEARRSMGLPDVAAMQEAVLKDIQERMMDHVGSMHPSEMLKKWVPMGVDSWMEMQKKLWGQMASSGTQEDDDS